MPSYGTFPQALDAIRNAIILFDAQRLRPFTDFLEWRTEIGHGSIFLATDFASASQIAAHTREAPAIFDDASSRVSRRRR